MESISLIHVAGRRVRRMSQNMRRIWKQSLMSWTQSRHPQNSTTHPQPSVGGAPQHTDMSKKMPLNGGGSPLYIINVIMNE